MFTDGDWWNYLNEEEREDVIIAVLDVYLNEVTKTGKDYRPTDLRAIALASLCVQAFKVVDYEETQEYMIQRIWESCQQHGHAIIDRFYHHLDHTVVKEDLAMKCFERKLPLWEVYRHWLQHLSSNEESLFTVNDYIKIRRVSPHSSRYRVFVTAV